MNSEAVGIVFSQGYFSAYMIFSLSWIHITYVSINFRVGLLAPRQFYDCSRAREIILNGMGKISKSQ